MSISSGARKPRSCVDFAEIVCRFSQVIDWDTLEIGSDLGIFTEVENCWKERSIAEEVDMVRRVIAEEVDDEKTKGTAAENSSSSRKRLAGRPARSTAHSIRTSVD